MVKVILYAALLLPLLCITSCKTNSNKDTADKNKSDKNKEEFQNFSNEFVAAWEKHDPKALADFWTDDGDLLSLWSAVYSGKPAIEKLFAKEQANEMKHSHIKIVVENVRLIDPETAFVDADLTISGMTVDGEKAVPLHDHAVYLFVKRDGKWRILIARPY